MKSYLKAVALFVLGFSICLVFSQSLAQEVEEMEYTWGTVSSVSANQIVLREYDYESYEEVDVTYTIDPQVNLKNVDSLEDIKAGDNIEIDYVVSAGKNVAKVIAVEEPSYTEESTPWQTDEEEPDYSSDKEEY